MFTARWLVLSPCFRKLFSTKSYWSLRSISLTADASCDSGSSCSGSSPKKRGAAPSSPEMETVSTAAARRMPKRQGRTATSECSAEGGVEPDTFVIAPGDVEPEEDALEGVEAEPNPVIVLEVAEVDVVPRGRDAAPIPKQRHVEAREGLPSVLRVQHERIGIPKPELAVAT